ncbi:hypothetical protein K3727_14985 [Rhodobacteraceae bacterium M382]|nr:hypothetical protein K3727_14985 [Rhodobacteraceae bacterium M382]
MVDTMGLTRPVTDAGQKPQLGGSAVAETTGTTWRWHSFLRSLPLGKKF